MIQYVSNKSKHTFRWWFHLNHIDNKSRLLVSFTLSEYYGWNVSKNSYHSVDDYEGLYVIRPSWYYMIWVTSTLGDIFHDSPILGEIRMAKPFCLTAAKTTWRLPSDLEFCSALGGNEFRWKSRSISIKYQAQYHLVQFLYVLNQAILASTSACRAEEACCRASLKAAV